MKNTILLTLFVLLTTTLAHSQCCPYLGEIKILPEYPTTADSVYLITNVTTPNLGYYLGYEIESGNNNELLVRSCYGQTGATALQDFTDTINLGIQAAGEYTLDFYALVSVEDLECIPYDSTSVALTFEVSGANATSSLVEDMGLYLFPNPTSNGSVWLRADNAIAKIQVLDVDGRLVFERENLSTQHYQLELSPYAAGIYFLKVTDNKGSETTKKVLNW